MNSRQDFRIPTASVRKQFAVYVFVVPILSLVITPLLGVQASLSSRLWSSGLFVAVLVAAYVLAVRWVYVSITPDAILGRGETWRKVAIQWSESAHVKAATVAAMQGVFLRRASDTGAIRGRLQSLFIPRQILDLPSFRLAVHTYAPANHPIRAFLERGT